MNDKVNKLIEAFKNKLDIFDKLMNLGTTTTEIVEFEKFIGQKLPLEYIDLLQKYNGEKHILCCMAGFGFSSIEDVKINWKLFDNQEHRKPEKIFQETKITATLFSDKRIPFAHDGSGNYLCIDFLPNTAGRIGQIIYLPLGEDETISVIADSFKDFITFLINAIENERLKLIDEREDWDEQDWQMAELHFFSTWNDDWTDIADEYNNKK